MRTVLLILASLLLMSLLGALWQLATGRQLLADVPLLLVLYLAVTKRRDPVLVRGAARPTCTRLLVASDVLAVLAVGYVADLMSASPKGLHALALGVVYLLGRAVRQRLDFGNLRGQLTLACLGSLVMSGVIVGVRWSIDGVGGWTVLLPVALHALATAALAAPVVGLFSHLDERLDRRPFGSTLIE